MKKELRTEVKKDRKAKIKGEIEQEMEGVENDNSNEQIKEKTLYDENDGLYRLIKDNLTMTEAIVIQEEIKSGVHGNRTSWYRRHEDKNKKKFGVWQLILSKSDMDSTEIAKFRESVDMIEKGDNEQMSKMDKETIEHIKDDIKTMHEDHKVFFLLLVSAVGGLYGICGAMYLRHILHVELWVLGIYGLILVIIGIAILWIQCELRECAK